MTFGAAETGVWSRHVEREKSETTSVETRLVSQFNTFVDSVVSHFELGIDGSYTTAH